MRRALSKLIPNKFSRSSSDLSSNTYRLDHGSVDEFYISLNSPHKSWKPGEEIAGQVILRSKKNLANIFITFNLSGYVKIHASPHSKLRPKKSVLFTHTIQIYGPKSSESSKQEFSNGLYKGEHRFPFIVKLPNKRIFTSIDFGKGAIMYVLSAHITSAYGNHSDTRSSSPGSIVECSNEFPGVHTPNTSSPEGLSSKAKEAFSRIHNPTYSYEKIIQLVNPLDVANLPSPKKKRLLIKNPRVGKLSRAQSSNSTLNTVGSASSVNFDLESVSTTQRRPSLEALGSIHSVSQQKTHTTSPQNISVSPSALPPGPLVKPSLDAIRVSMEVAQRGYLRGELIPIKLSINHLRKIQDSTGIIVTLVRVCRIDYGPDGYYESFRKDLQQSVIPLFVDPITFSSEISTSVRVPADAFPTISGCPLVSFQYFIEVMLNLSGKSLSLTTPLEQPKSSNCQQDESLHSISAGQVSAANYNFHSLANSRSEFINTDKFKRSRKFIQMTVEIVLGTHRSIKEEISLASAPSVHTTETVPDPSPDSNAQSSANTPLNSLNNTPSVSTVQEFAQMNNFDSPPYLYEQSQSPIKTPTAVTRRTPLYEEVTPPRPDLSGLSEKERMRQHEASLLPSAPNFEESDEEHLAVTTSAGHSPLHVAGANVCLRNDYLRGESIMVTAGQLQFTGTDEIGIDDLYQAPDLHDGIGSEGANDYVPKYSAAPTDRIVDQR